MLRPLPRFASLIPIAKVRMKSVAIFAPALCLFGAATLAPAAAAPATAPVLAHVRAAGVLACGVLSEPGDYTMDDTHGPLLDFGQDLCRAVAAAVLGDAGKLRMAYLPDEAHGFAALKAANIDLLIGASARVTAGALDGLGFGRPVFFDGQGFLVHSGAHIATLKDLAGAQICFIVNTLAEYDLHGAMTARHIAFRPYPFSERGEMEAALVSGDCAVMTGDLSLLADSRAEFRGRAGDFAILPDRITLDPIAPAWRDEDPQFGRIVDWTVSALLQAEQAGVGQVGAARLAAAEHPDAAAQALVRGDAAAAQVLGLNPGWSLRAIAAVGNYAELYRRDIGEGSALGLPRGPNALWDAGGLMYPLSTR
jgi:general L-amino acid transport system substrate-binding protein